MEPLALYTPDVTDIVENEVVGSYIVKCTDPYIIRIIFEIIASIADGAKSALNFDKDGITCIDSTSDNEILVNVKISKNRLIYYKARGEIIDKPVIAYTDLTDLTGILKSTNRREIIQFEAGYNITGEVVSFFMPNNMGIDRVGLVRSYNVKKFVDIYQEYYADSEPKGSISVADFSQIISKFKSRKCTNIKFKPVEDGIIVEGYVLSIVVSVYHIQNDGTVIADEDPKQNPNTIINGGSGVQLTIIDDSGVNINLTKNGNWITKIPRSSPATSVVSIYLEKRTPLVFKTYIGSIGKAYYEFV